MTRAKCPRCKQGHMRVDILGDIECSECPAYWHMTVDEYGHKQSTIEYKINTTKTIGIDDL